MNDDAVIAAISGFEITPSILDTVCRATGMGFAAIARVTDTRWIACATKDEIAFGLEPGGQLELESTICNEIREHRKPVIISDVECDDLFRNHHTPARYGFRSYISYPIILPDGDFFGTLCAIHPEPIDLTRPEIVNIFKLFAELIGFHLSTALELDRTAKALTSERASSGFREQFIAILGHDLRNPLTSVQAGVAMLEKGASPERAPRIFEGLRGSIDRMWALIDDMLDFARGHLGDGIKIAKKPVALSPIISQVVAELVTSHPERDVEVHLSADEPVSCDPERISQLVSNLVGNALTHGAQDRPVTIEGTTERGVFQLTVTNGGEPIPEDRKAGLFHPFSSSSKGSARDGLGLGLFIASEIAKAHGGTLSVTSDESQTRFTFKMAARSLG